jgi:hypothetical protein
MGVPVAVGWAAREVGLVGTIGAFTSLYGSDRPYTLEFRHRGGADETAGINCRPIACSRGRTRASTASPPRIPRIALVDPVIPASELSEAAGPTYRGFFEELARRGYVEGRNLLIERFSGVGQADHYPELAREVVRLNPDLIYAHSTRMVLDFKASTTTIPIVSITPDPVRLA